LLTALSIQSHRGALFHALSMLWAAPLLTILFAILDEGVLFSRPDRWSLFFVYLCGALTWYSAQYLLSRYLSQSGWVFRPRREALRLRHDGEIDFAATQRQDWLIASTGWTSIAGVFLVTASCAFIPALLEGLSRSGETSQLATATASFLRSVLATTAVGLIPLVTVSTVAGLLAQSMLTMVCFACVGISWKWVAGSSWQGAVDDALVWACLAMPAVFCTRGLNSLADRFTRFHVGLAVIKKEPMFIRSIMLWTLMAGVQIVLLRAVAWESPLLAAAAGLSAVGIWLTFLTLRRHLGDGAWWINFISLVVPVIILLGGFAGAAAYAGQSIIGAILLGSLWFSCYFVALWLSIGWLQYIGWRPLPTRSSLRSACEPPQQPDAS
jgi:hypothetical protein